MKEQRDETIRRAFRPPLRVGVKVTPDGFEIDDHHFEELIGRVTKMDFVRKLFDDHFLACSSPDGHSGIDGKLCRLCNHPNCHPRLRIQLSSGNVTYVLELAVSSARNLFLAQDEATRENRELWQVPLRLTVANRGYWGEVCFEKILPNEVEAPEPL